ncbi:glucoamylase family protein [Allomesorhizobium alhagi]|uniref:glucoamylase family protein n=1 Tax=Allomesorhizobium alhagi TaxID=475067 RepID=UPI001FCCA24E|nr:glucoamylase family protein [Mesorhizobium alhagi]
MTRDTAGLSDRYADYWQQNLRHTQINYRHCVRNPYNHLGYSSDCWGLTASHGPRGYVASAPDTDFGVITPSAALSSFPYAPAEAMRALRGFLTKPRKRIWGRFGFVDAFCEGRNWYFRTYLAINQGPIIAMIENHQGFCGDCSWARRKCAGLGEAGLHQPASGQLNVCTAQELPRIGPGWLLP